VWNKDHTKVNHTFTVSCAAEAEGGCSLVVDVKTNGFFNRPAGYHKMDDLLAGIQKACAETRWLPEKVFASASSIDRKLQEGLIESARLVGAERAYVATFRSQPWFAVDLGALSNALGDSVDAASAGREALRPEIEARGLWNYLERNILGSLQGVAADTSLAGVCVEFQILRGGNTTPSSYVYVPTQALLASRRYEITNQQLIDASYTIWMGTRIQVPPASGL
jgi:hypothetical protein